MLYRWINLNIRMTKREFGVSMVLVLAAMIVLLVTSAQGSFQESGAVSIGLFSAILGGAAVFFLLGAAKLYHSSMLGQSASLYMTLPVSYWKMVWGKLLTGGFQLFLLQLLGLCGLILASASAASNGIQQPVMINLELNVKSVIMGGVPAEHIGFFCLELFLAMFLADMLFCAGILLAAVTVHAMRLSSAKVPLGILIYGFVLALLAAGIWLAFLCMKNAAAPHALLSLTGVTLMNAAALLFFAFLNKTLLSKRLEVN